MSSANRAAGETHKTVQVEVLPDTHDDAGETLKLKLSGNDTGYLARATATGTIENTGPMPRAWLARSGRTASDHTLDAIGRRMDAARGGIRPESHLSLGGQRVDGLPERFGALFNTFLADDEARGKPAVCRPAQGDALRCHTTNTARGRQGRGPDTGRDIARAQD